MTPLHLAFLKRSFTYLFVSLLSFSVFAQAYSLNIGKTNFSRKKQASTLLSSAIPGSPRSFRTIGGVDFQQVASPDLLLEQQEIKLFYDEKQPDGHRLTVEIENQEYNPYLPDWQLKPIAEFADSEHTSLVSLFGKRIDPNNSQIVYHPSMIDNLMGLRILQADILLTDPQNYWHLPIDNNDTRGQIIGLGETPPIQQTTQHTAMAISQEQNYESIANMIQFLMHGEITSGDNDFDSWILTDFDEVVRFGVECDSFTISGTPYFYFHKTDMLRYTQEVGTVLNDIAQNQEELDEEVSALLSNIVEDYRLCAIYYDSLAVYNAAADQIMEKYKDVSPQDLQFQEEEVNILRRRRFLEDNLTSLTDDLFEMIQDEDNVTVLKQNGQASRLAEASPVHPQEKLTYLMRHTFPELFEKINPAVHSASVNAMKFSAFFRYMKEKDPDNWEAFLEEIKKVSYQPTEIYTPESIIQTTAPNE